MDVFLRWHNHELPGGEDNAKLIGAYSTPELADQARQRATALPGFRDSADGFVVDRYEVDRDHWTEGFVAIHYRQVPSPGASPCPTRPPPAFCAATPPT